MKQLVACVLLALVLVRAAASDGTLQDHSLANAAADPLQQQYHRSDTEVTGPKQQRYGPEAGLGRPAGVPTTAAADAVTSGAPAARLLLRHKHREKIFLLADPDALQDIEHASGTPAGSLGPTKANLTTPTAPTAPSSTAPTAPSSTADAAGSGAAVLEVVQGRQSQADR